MKIPAVDDPNQFPLAIFKVLVLKSADFLRILEECGRHCAPPGFRLKRQNDKENVDLLPVIMIPLAPF